MTGVPIPKLDGSRQYAGITRRDHIPLCVYCARCDKPVDRTEVYHDEWNRVLIIRVSCHGDTDTGIVTDRELFLLGRDGIPEQIAFRTDKLLPPSGIPDEENR